MDWGWIILPAVTVALGALVMRAFRNDPVRRRMRAARDREIRGRLGGLGEADRTDRTGG